MASTLLIDQKNKVDLHLLCDGVWEPDRIEFLQSLILKYRSSARTIFLDIGAHGALYSIVLCKAMNFDRVIAFEPAPQNLAQIYANLLMNGLLDKVQVLSKAASNQTGHCRFMLSHESNRGQSRVVNEGETGAGSAIEVETTTVDQILYESGSLIVAKIDVEGHEGEVILGMMRTISENHVVLQVEVNSEIERIVNLLRPLGLVQVHAIESDYYFVKA